MMRATTTDGLRTYIPVPVWDTPSTFIERLVRGLRRWRIRLIAVALAFVIVWTSAPALAQSLTLAGKATDQTHPGVPYTDYRVQLRDVATGQVVATTPLTASGLFVFDNLRPARFLVELARSGAVVCTEGPFAPGKTDIRVSCGKLVSALWLLGAAAFTASAVSIATRSTSR